MADKKGTPGSGPLGTENNSPIGDTGTSARMQHKPASPQGDWKWFDDNVAFPAAAHGLRTIRKGIGYVMGDKQGRFLLDLWMSGKAADEVILDDEEWGNYMRAESGLQDQIHKKLERDAYAFRERINQNNGRLEGDYQSSFHGEVGTKSFTGQPIDGGYFTGYQILHGSKKTGTLKDVQIIGKFTAVRNGQAPDSPLTVTYHDLRFVWDDIINVNVKYGADIVFGNYARNENRYTGNPQPKDYTVHIKWNAKEPIVVTITGYLPTFIPPKNP
jgi:hypothetical protein